LSSSHPSRCNLADAGKGAVMAVRAGSAVSIHRAHKGGLDEWTTFIDVTYVFEINKFD